MPDSSSPSGQGQPPAIELTGVTKHFGDVRAVDGIDLTVQPGEVVAFLGPNGAGKTTTLDMVLALSEPTAGSVRIDGLPPRRAIDAGRVSAVTQTGGLLNGLTVAEHVRLIAGLFGYPKSHVADVMERAGVAAIATRKTQQCSGGEKQRLKFAMALVSDPDLLILDEPTTGMDVQARRDFWSGIHDQATRGRTVVFATHYLEEADEYADRIVMIVKGRIVADGTTAEVRNLVSGRTVTADFGSHDEAVRAAASVSGLVSKATVQGPEAVFATADSDAVLRVLLASTPARDILVASQGLEDAFLELTQAAEEAAK